MITRSMSLCTAILVLTIAAEATALSADLARGAKVFQACAACHSLEKGQHMTGPSLASIWERKAGTVDGFIRYSDALKHSGVVWDEKSLDAWLRDPAAFIPNNWMPFRGIDKSELRHDLIAYLKAVSEGKMAATNAQGMMGSPSLPDLRSISSEAQIAKIEYCGDTYYVTNASGRKMAFWEFNLRFKTDSRAHGPAPGKPVIVPAGMMGDRAQVVFSGPGEISAFIKPQCP